MTAPDYDLSELTGLIETHALVLGWWTRSPQGEQIAPQLEQALRNLAAHSPMARFAPNRKNFLGLLSLLEYPELVRLETRLKAQRPDYAKDQPSPV